MMKQQTLEAVHTHTHTNGNLIDRNRVEQCYSLCDEKKGFYFVRENVWNRSLFVV